MPGNAETVLQDLRKAVMEGQYAQLAVLMPALQDVEADFRSGDLITLRSLQAEAERTEACLQSALSGVRAARRRVVEVAKAAKGLTTYDRVGHKATVPTVTPTPRRV